MQYKVKRGRKRNCSRSWAPRDRPQTVARDGGLWLRGQVHSPELHRAPHCTLALTDALPVSVNVQVFVLSLPLEQAPDQMASRPFVTLSVTDVPEVKDADPVLPTFTLMPVGLDVTRSPLRPVAVTVNVAF